MPDLSKSQFSERTHSHLNGYIKFADQKASLLLTAHLAFLGLFANVIKTSWMASGLSFKLSSTLVVFASLVATGFAGWTVYPRTPKTQQGLLLWDSINNKTPEEYKQEIHNLTDESALNELIDENYQLAKVAVEKYKHLRFALIFTAVMLGAAVFTISQLLL